MTQQERAIELEEALRSVAMLQISEESVESTLGAIAKRAVELIPGADFGGVSLLRADTITTIGSTDQIVDELDGIQYEVGQGPCLSSIEAQVTHRVNDLAPDETWPEFSGRAAALGARSLLSFVLKVSETSLGALNLYSQSVHAFDEEDERIGAIFAAQAAVALANAETHQMDQQKADQWHQAALTRDVIGQAKGILMARLNCSDDEAFEMLRTASQNLNRKVRDVAGDMVQKNRLRT